MQKLRDHGIQLEKWTEWTSPYICLLINTGKHRVLVDTGAGDLAPSTGRLIPNLKAEGIDPEDIDTVILTHGHVDHIGGNVGRGKSAFPNAHFHMWKGEWDFWTSDPAKLDVPEHIKPLFTFAHYSLSPIQGQIHLIDHETDIVPGIHAVAAPGHTIGQMALTISSEDKQLLVIADAALHPIHLESPDWYAAIEFVPDKVAATRRQLLSQAAAEKALVLAFHFPFPGLGHIVQKGEGWEWQPVQALG